MEITIGKAILHQHNLKEQNTVLTEVEIDITSQEEKKQHDYFAELIRENSKKNSGKLANFNHDSQTRNILKDYVDSIILNSNGTGFIKTTHLIMKNLIVKHTHGNSTSGNYLFLNYHIVDEEKYLDDNGVLKSINIDEMRFSILKMELGDTQYVEYTKNEDGKLKSNVKIEEDNGLPGPKEKLKKACFISHPKKNMLNYDIRVIDKETSGVAHFFTNNILNCRYIVKPQYYLIKLRNVVMNYMQLLERNNEIDSVQANEIVNDFNELLVVGGTIRQEELGNHLLNRFIDNDEDLNFHNEKLLDNCHESGLTFNTFKVTEKDLKYINDRKYLKISPKSFLRYSQDDKERKIIVFDDTKKTVTIYLKESPSVLERNEN